MSNETCGCACHDGGFYVLWQRELAAREAAEKDRDYFKASYSRKLTDELKALGAASDLMDERDAERVANAGLRDCLRAALVCHDNHCDDPACAPLSVAPPNAQRVQENQIEYMVQRFLTWKIPANFSPDAGISFKPFGHPASWPIGTNLFDANQAAAMVRHMIEGMPHGEALLALEKQLADERQQVDDARQQLYETNEAHNDLVAENTRIRDERDAYGAENALLRDALQALLAALIERDHGSHCDGDVVDPFALCILCAETVDDPDAMPVHDPARACAKAAALLTAAAAPASVPPAAAPQEQQGALICGGCIDTRNLLGASGAPVILENPEIWLRPHLSDCPAREPLLMGGQKIYSYAAAPASAASEPKAPLAPAAAGGLWCDKHGDLCMGEPGHPGPCLDANAHELAPLAAPIVQGEE